jgi:hypothetical protein
MRSNRAPQTTDRKSSVGGLFGHRLHAARRTDDDKDAKKGKSLAGARHGERGGRKTYAATTTTTTTTMAAAGKG